MHLLLYRVAAAGCKMLSRRYHAHVHILLVGSLDLLLLLLKQFDLLLDCKLFHCKAVDQYRFDVGELELR